MSVLRVFMSILQDWRKAFCKKQAFEWSIKCAIGLIYCLTRHTISNALICLGLDHLHPSSAYALFARFKWKTEDLFNPILKRALEAFDSPYIIVAADDTKIPKTGKKIITAFWQRHPLSPKFRYNLMWGLRFLQFSLLIKPQGNGFPTKAMPIRLEDIPNVKCPKNATAEDKKNYRKALNEKGLPSIFIKMTLSLREALNLMGFAVKKLLIVVNGSFCNKICMRFQQGGIELLARCRKDIKLYFQATEGRCFYASTSFTPENVRTDQSSWSKKEFFYGGGMRMIRYKEVNHVFWKNSTLKRPLRLIVIAPTPYFRGGRRLYRQPAYLLCTDLNAELGLLI